MKKKVSLLVLILVLALGASMILSVFFRCKDMEIDDIIWTKYVYGKNGQWKGEIYLYSNGKTENIGDIMLRHVSKKGESLLIGVQNLGLPGDRYKGIVTYDIFTKEVREILECDKIDDFLGRGNHDFRGNIQMAGDGKFFYFVCGDKMILYDVEKDRLEILFETMSDRYFLNEKETHLYFSDDHCIICRYNLQSRTKEPLIKNVNYFAVSRDEKMIVYVSRETDELFLYRLDTGETEKLVKLTYPYSEMNISRDNRYILYTNYKESIIPTNRRIEICVLDLETGKRKIIYRGDYEDNIGNVLW